MLFTHIARRSAVLKAFAAHDAQLSDRSGLLARQLADGASDVALGVQQGRPVLETRDEHCLA
jgi:hypothetical protein